MNSFKEDLVKKIQMYLANEISTSSLVEFAWHACDELLATHTNTQILEYDASFWYSLWEIQQLGSKEKLTDHDRQILKKSLAYMDGQEKLPESYLSYRPLRRELRAPSD